MDSIYLLVPVTVIILAVAILIFIWAVNDDQFDDMDSPASRILFDDDEQATIDQIKKQNSEKILKKQRNSKHKTASEIASKKTGENVDG